MKTITMYADGACRGNPGPGGIGVVLLWGDLRKELSGGYKYTTNNRMELLGVIVGLEALKEESIVHVYTDSLYVVDAVKKGWLFTWVAKANFGGKKNEDLWRRFLAVYEQHKVTMHWVKGHADTVENGRCDALAVAAATGQNLLVDGGYKPKPKK